MSKSRFIEITSAGLIAIFLYTGIMKLIDHATFNYQLQQSSWNSLSVMSGVISWGLPIFEIAVSILLIRGKTRKYGLIFSTLLMLVFTLYLIVLLTSKVKLPCSCGGIIGSLSWQNHLILNIVLLVVSTISMYMAIRDNNIKVEIIYW